MEKVGPNFWCVCLSYKVIHQECTWLAHGAGPTCVNALHEKGFVHERQGKCLCKSTLGM